MSAAETALHALAKLQEEEGHTWETSLRIAAGQLSALTAAGLVVVNRPVMQIVLLLLSSARDKGTWDQRFLGDINDAIDAVRSLLGIAAAQEPK